jgi:2-polyprenyl-6-methoxyphenol hydroxylase-like FAD-dependent oxidoreductase
VPDGGATCYYLYDRDPVEQWTFGPVTLLGDAAHPFLPFGSQGAGQAFLDAEALGRAVDQTSSLQAALKEYENMRCELAGKIVIQNRGMGPTKVLRFVEEGAQSEEPSVQQKWIDEHKDDISQMLGAYKKLSTTGASVSSS